MIAVIVLVEMKLKSYIDTVSYTLYTEWERQ